jgi:tRNA (adenine37-N6)-methyltransferase
MLTSEPINYQPIGVIRTPHQEAVGTPIQPSGAAGVLGVIHLLPELAPGLKDLDGFSHVMLIYHLHHSQGFNLEVIPYMDTQPRGVFATRAPRRPNPIGFSVVRLLGIRGTEMDVEGVDMLDGTPLLDIKPFVPDFDAPPVERTGWLEQNSHRARGLSADGRFHQP